MLPLAALIGLVAAVWYVTRGAAAEGRLAAPVAPAADKESEMKKLLFPSDVPATRSVSDESGKGYVASYGPDGSSDFPFDPAVLFGAFTPPSVDLSTDLASGIPVDLGGFLGGSAARAIPVVTLPKSATFDENFGYAAAPLETDTRVLFAVDMPSTEGGSGEERAGVLEGLYYGPSRNFTYEGATVVVDRIADVGAGDLQPGKYAIPPSRRNGDHSYLEVVTWQPVTPESLDMISVINPPKLDKGDKLTLAAKDGVGNTVVWIGQVHESLSDGRYDVILQKAYKVLTDIGDGKISPPLLLSQALVRLAPTMLVNPKSIP